MCVLHSGCHDRMFTSSPTFQESILYHSTVVNQLHHTDIRLADSSLFFRKDVIAISLPPCVALPSPSYVTHLQSEEGQALRSRSRFTSSSSPPNSAMLGSYYCALTLLQKSMAGICSLKMVVRTVCGDRST